MIKEVGTVVKLEQGIAWVETKVTSTCNACAAKSNCGTSSIAKAFGDKSVINEVENEKNAQLGEKVEIGIPEQSLLTGAFLVYLLPLITAVVAALLSEFWLSRFVEVTEPMLIVITIAGGWLGFFIARKRVAAAETEYRVRMLRVMPESLDIKELS